MPDAAEHGLTPAEWQNLIGKVRTGKCTPFLGAGASHPPLPLGRELAEKWAREHNYPLADKYDLARVAQFLRVTGGGADHPRQLMVDEIKNVEAPDFNDPDQIHRALAHFRFPLYLTTNYDNFMCQALQVELQDIGGQPRREFFPWQPKYSEEGNGT